MDKGARIPGAQGGVYEYLGDDIAQFKIIGRDGKLVGMIPSKDILILAATIIRPRLVAKANSFVDELFKGIM